MEDFSVAADRKFGEVVIETSALAKRFGHLMAVDHIDLSIREGEVFGLLGPNGAGKTTVLNLMCGFYKPDQGSVNLGARDCANLPSHAIARAGIARTNTVWPEYPAPVPVKSRSCCRVPSSNSCLLQTVRWD